MPRRVAGSAVLGGVLLVLVVVAAVRGRTVAGQPTAPPVQAAPQVGDCVLQNPHDLGAGLYDLPALRTGPCSGPRFGDVVFVVPDFTVPTGDAAPGPDPCQGPVDHYLGTPPPPPPSDGSFMPFAGVMVALIGPDGRQRAAGQKWAACMVYLPISIDATAPITIDHPLQGAWQRPEDSRLFALCVDNTTTLWAVNCRWTHHFEVLGIAVGTPTITQEALNAACRQVVIQALGSSTALNRRELTTQVLPARPKPNNDGTLITGPDAITPDSEYNNFCLTTPADSTRQLTAPLRGLGDEAVPMN
jgi:hypothetical protein